MIFLFMVKQLNYYRYELHFNLLFQQYGYVWKLMKQEKALTKNIYD